MSDTDISTLMPFTLPNSPNRQIRVVFRLSPAEVEKLDRAGGSMGMSPGQFSCHMALLSAQGHFAPDAGNGRSLSDKDKNMLHALVRSDGVLLNQMVLSLNTIARAARAGDLVDPKFKKVSERVNFDDIAVMINRFTEHERNVRAIVVAAEAALPKRGYKKRKISDA